MKTYVFAHKITIILVVLVLSAAVFAIAASAVSDRYNFNSPVVPYTTEYVLTDNIMLETVIDAQQIAHNYAVLLFRHGYKTVVGTDGVCFFEDYDLQYLMHDEKNKTWAGVFKDEHALRFQDEIVLEFRYDGMVVSAPILYGKKCDLLTTREAAEDYANMVYWYLSKNHCESLARTLCSLNNNGRYWSAWYWERGSTACGGGFGIGFAADGKLSSFEVGE